MTILRKVKITFQNNRNFALGMLCCLIAFVFILLNELDVIPERFQVAAFFVGLVFLAFAIVFDIFYGKELKKKKLEEKNDV